MEFNKYDFGIASQRIQKYIEQSLANMEADGAGRAIILFGGDLLNSDRRLDEITAACTNRTQAMVLAVEILQQAIARVAEVYEVDIFWVCGNEGRVNKELGFSDFVASDNYDHAIPMMLRHLFAKHEGVTFHYPKNAMECVFKVNGLYWLILHGHVGGGGAPDKKAAGLRAKYAERGICLSYIVWGHIHEAYISDLFARSGSPAGGNSFSDNALGLGGKASLNYYVVSKLGEISGRTIPLQNVDGYEGYDFDERLISYNIKSAKKAERKNVVLEIVV
jgi:predicted phosphodiesterase